MWEIAKAFRFESAHTLHRSIDAESSRRIHGHSYRAEVAVRGRPMPASGMILDLAALGAVLDTARECLDHRFLDEVPGLGPATMENLARWIWDCIAPSITGLHRVTVCRDSLEETCSYFGPEQAL